jgi:magnesium chelatase family protein
MSIAILRSRALAGLQAPEVAVEVHVGNGLPAFSLVGLPDAEVREARDRVQGCHSQFGFRFSGAAHHRQSCAGRSAEGIRAFRSADRSRHPDRRRSARCTGAGPLRIRRRTVADRRLRRVRGALPMALGAREGGRSFVLPIESASEAVMVCGVDVFAATSLLDVCAHLCGRALLPRAQAARPPRRRHTRIWPTYAGSCRRAVRSKSPLPGIIPC